VACAVLAAGAVALPAASADTYPDVDVYKVDARGHVIDLTANRALDTSPSPSPDGTRIAFVSSRDGQPDIYVMPAAGGAATRLTTSPFDDEIVAWNDAGKTAIAWSPDSKRIAFDVVNATVAPTCFTNCTIWSIYVANADGSARHPVVSPARSPAWSHDGRYLAYEDEITPYGESVGVAIDRLDGSAPVRLPVFNASPDVGPVWSPRRNELAFQASARWVYTVQADGSARRRSARGLNPAWSPDGTALAFALGGTLYRSSRTGTRIRRIASGLSGVAFPVWSPGGRAIAFLASSGGGPPQIAVVGARGGRVLRLASAAGYDGGLAWLGRTGSLVFSRCASASACPS
jgi:Tol biopolymer transport system component